MTREEKEKITECEHMSFDYIGKIKLASKVICLDAVKNIINDISESEYISNDNSDSDSEKAIKELKILKEDYWDDDGCGHETKQYNDIMFALDMAIKALEQEPTTKNDLAVDVPNTNVGDIISRQAAIDAMATWDWQDLYLPIHFQQLLEELPSVKPQEPRKGKWIEGPNCSYRCSNCGEHYFSIQDYIKYKFCPNCGVKMDESEEEDG